MSECKHPTCGDTCRREKRIKKDHYINRTPLKSKPVKIRKYSKKREKINRKEYGPKARRYVLDHPVCNIQSPVCTYFATCVNHIRSKDTIQDLLDDQYWESSCFPCNSWIESNDAWARERGHKVSKHQITTNRL